eukprot:m.241597 g.241597  ORF g.241597 m.241597 type:complete len:310 (-) comp23802_c0_seq1:100-1029(-)
MPICQHNGCGKEYTEEENTDNVCQFHPGTPIFHEGLKGWSCCKKRFCDFGEFLSHPGCAFGKHTDVKEENDVDANATLKELAQAPVDRLSLEQKQKDASMRDTTSKVDVPVSVTASSEKALAKLQAKKSEATNELKVGQPCTRNACKGTYEGETSNEEDCVHHPGEPVFHEGYKYWSCCPKKKTIDFDEFLEMKGCATGTHRWVKPAEAKVKKCRYDWFQSEDKIMLTVYAKCVDPEKLSVKANSDSLTIDLVYEEVNKFTLELHLGGKIAPSECAATLSGTNLKVKLAKEDWVSWDDLEAGKATKEDK